ncbi:uncharacterized protein LOC117301374 [Asterias rubens]|uniref:uncharacterized protein LOC117301374 n=1 Tax=Asterias rubens TaxID=7604 RepID=UPI001454EB87|nr:uncharacterized protein LOC117301374 [Asterias rubens]
MFVRRFRYSPSNMIGIAVFVGTFCVACTSVISPRRFEFERGSRGVVPCPAMVDRGYSASDIEAIYWFFVPEGSSHSPESIITYFHGVTTHQSSNTERYDVQNTSLVITNVTGSAAGTYSYRYVSWLKVSEDGSVKVTEKVSCKSKRPKVSQYIDDQLSWEGTDSSNTVEVPSDTAELNLTCRAEHAKPAINISWFVWFPFFKRWEEIPAKPRVQPASCETECFFVNGTFNSDVTFMASLERNNVSFKCVAHTSRLEDIEVTIIKKQHVCVTANPQEVADRANSGLNEPTTPMTKLTKGIGTFLILVTATMNFVLVVLFLFWRHRFSKRLDNNPRHHDERKMDNLLDIRVDMK